MNQQKIAGINAIAFFFFWLIILLAGADKPPPPGFLWVVLVVAACAIVVYWRIPTYIDWYRTLRPGRQWRVVLEGVIAGIVVALLSALGGSGKPSVTMQPIDYAIWFTVLGVIGALNSAVLYFINAQVVRRADAKE